MRAAAAAAAAAVRLPVCGGGARCNMQHLSTNPESRHRTTHHPRALYVSVSVSVSVSGRKAKQNASSSSPPRRCRRVEPHACLPSCTAVSAGQPAAVCMLHTYCTTLLLIRSVCREGSRGSARRDWLCSCSHLSRSVARSTSRQQARLHRGS